MMKANAGPPARGQVAKPHLLESLTDQVQFTAIRAQGPGGQHVNKAATAVQLRFDIRASSLPEAVKMRLLALGDQRVSQDGVIVIKAQTARSQQRNRELALARLAEMVRAASHVPRTRRATRPTRGAVERRLRDKAQRAQVKAGRRE